jgi:F-type H+-transporting ATPase subunit delta
MAELSARYAAALVDLAIEDGALDEVLGQAFLVRDVLMTDGCLGAMKDPHISKAEKCRFIDEVFTGALHKDLYGLLRLLVEKSHENFMIDAVSGFIAKAEEHNGKTTAVVVSAAELDGNQVESLKAVLSKKLDKQVEINQRIDVSLIGGLYILVDGYLIDRTVRKQLKDLRDSIKKVL